MAMSSEKEKEREENKRVGGGEKSKKEKEMHTKKKNGRFFCDLPGVWVCSEHSATLAAQLG